MLSNTLTLGSLGAIDIGTLNALERVKGYIQKSSPSGTEYAQVRGIFSGFLNSRDMPRGVYVSIGHINGPKAGQLHVYPIDHVGEDIAGSRVPPSENPFHFNNSPWTAASAGTQGELKEKWKGLGFVPTNVTMKDLEQALDSGLNMGSLKNQIGMERRLQFIGQASGQGRWTDVIMQAKMIRLSSYQATFVLEVLGSSGIQVPGLRAYFKLVGYYAGRAAEIEHNAKFQRNASWVQDLVNTALSFSNKIFAEIAGEVTEDYAHAMKLLAVVARMRGELMNIIRLSAQGGLSSTMAVDSSNLQREGAKQFLIDAEKTLDYYNRFLSASSSAWAATGYNLENLVAQYLKENPLPQPDLIGRNWQSIERDGNRGFIKTTEVEGLGALGEGGIAIATLATTGLLVIVFGWGSFTAHMERQDRLREAELARREGREAENRSRAWQMFMQESAILQTASRWDKASAAALLKEIQSYFNDESLFREILVNIQPDAESKNEARKNKKKWDEDHTGVIPAPGAPGGEVNIKTGSATSGDIPWVWIGAAGAALFAFWKFGPFKDK